MSRFDVIVLGAGPAGACAALALAREGRRVALVDKGPLPDPARWAEIVPRAALEPLRAWGLVEAALARAWPLERLRLRLAGQPDRELPLPAGRLLALEGGALVDALLEAAVEAGARLLGGLAVGSVTEEEGGVRVITSHGSRFEAEHLVGADGASSIVAARLGLGAGGRGSSQVACLGPLALEPGGPPGPGPRTLEIEPIPHGHLHRVETPSGMWAAGCLHRPLPRGSLGEQLRAWLARAGPPGRPTERTLPTYRPDRILHGRRTLLVGDAAGLADPLSGLGLGAALASGLQAGELLSRALSGQASLSEHTPALHRPRQARAGWPGRWGRAAQRSPRLTYEVARRLASELTLWSNRELDGGELLGRWWISGRPRRDMDAPGGR